jgi:hypothetical protein
MLAAAKAAAWVIGAAAAAFLLMLAWMGWCFVCAWSRD